MPKVTNKKNTNSRRILLFFIKWQIIASILERIKINLFAEIFPIQISYDKINSLYKKVQRFPSQRFTTYKFNMPFMADSLSYYIVSCLHCVRPEATDAPAWRQRLPLTLFFPSPFPLEFSQFSSALPFPQIPVPFVRPPLLGVLGDYSSKGTEEL